MAHGDHHCGPLSDQIMHYYLKYGQNRDLEKYLRLKNHLSPTAPEDRSLENAAILDAYKAKMQAKSETKCQGGEKSSALSSETVEGPPTTSDEPKVEKPVVDQQPTKITKVEKISKKTSKSMINLASTVEINFPQMHPFNVGQPQPVAIPEVRTSTTETQTTLERPIEPVVITKNAETSCGELSPSNSLASTGNKSDIAGKPKPVRNIDAMEWDSLADVGYNLKLVGTNLSEAEKEALKKYFDQQGLSFNEEKIVVFQTPLKVAPLTMSREDKATSMSDRKSRPEEKWQNIFKKYKAKYQYLDDSCVEIRSFSSPDAKSTPKKTEDAETGCPIATQTSYVENVCKEVQTSPPPKDDQPPENLPDVDVSTQTSCIEIVSKEVQASPPPQQNQKPDKQPDVNVSTQTSLVKITSQATSPQNQASFGNPPKTPHTLHEEGMSTAASFEFFTKSKTAPNEEGESPLAMTLPSKTTSRLSSDSRNSSSSNQALTVQSFDEDLNLAMSVLNRIFRSKSMNSELKKTLVAEILQKISRNHEVPFKSKTPSPESSLDSFLQPQTHSEIDFQSLKITGEVSKQPITTLDRAPPPNPKSTICSKDQQRAKTAWIDQEIDQLYNLKKLMTLPSATKPASAPRYLSSLPARTTGNIYENIEKLKHKIGELKKRNSDTTQRRMTAERLMRRMTERARVTQESRSGTYDSHANLHKIIQSRSKLKTPVSSSASASEESILKFIKQRQGRHEEKYEENVYTRPYSGNGEAAYSMTPYSSVKPNPDPISTSISSLSHSISIPVSNSATNSTTTHYNHDLRTVGATHRMATQTTDSLTKTKPIFESRLGSKTVRIELAPNNKQMQARPPPVAYCLTFQRGEDVDELSSIEKADSTKSSRLTKARKNEQNSGKATLVGSTGDLSTELLTLEQQLAASRPQVYRQLERRSHLVNDLKQMRSERNLVRHELAQLPPETALAHLKHLPPAPLTTKRLFTTRTLKQATSRKCLVLPEVLRKQEVERLNRTKRLNRLVTEQFNRNLKQLTLKGKINLSNSVMIQ